MPTLYASSLSHPSVLRFQRPWKTQALFLEAYRTKGFWLKQQLCCVPTRGLEIGPRFWGRAQRSTNQMKARQWRSWPLFPFSLLLSTGKKKKQKQMLGFFHRNSESFRIYQRCYVFVCLFDMGFGHFGQSNEGKAMEFMTSLPFLSAQERRKKAEVGSKCWIFPQE